MNSKIGPLSFPPNNEEMTFEKPYSSATAKLIDHEVRELIASAYQLTENLLRGQREGLEKVARLLLEKEVLKKEDMESVFGPRPFDEPRTFESLKSL
jgi:AFG3 family protein